MKKEDGSDSSSDDDDDVFKAAAVSADWVINKEGVFADKKEGD